MCVCVCSDKSIAWKASMSELKCVRSQQSFLISSLLSHTHKHTHLHQEIKCHTSLSVKYEKAPGRRLGWQEQLLCFYNLFLFNASMDSPQRHACHQKMRCNITSVNNEHTQHRQNSRCRYSLCCIFTPQDEPRPISLHPSGPFNTSDS